MPDDATGEQDIGDEETVPATSYVTPIQYHHWQDEAEKRNQSVSTFISSMVEAGRRQISLEQGSPDEITDLRKQIQTLRSERDEVRRKLEATQQQDYQIGLGKIKELIVNNPGFTRREIAIHVSENPFIFVDKYLESLEDSEYKNNGGMWYPPESVGDN
jgi:hypothetical protein